MSEVHGWFHQKNEETLRKLIPSNGISTVAEIGTFLGLSAKFFASLVDKVYCIDKFVEVEEYPSVNNLVQPLRDWALPIHFYEIFEKNMRDAGVWDKVVPITGMSHAVLGQVPEVDLVYIDGDHSYEGCKRDIELYLPKAKKIICGDDYAERFPGVMQAVQELLPGFQSDGPFWWYVKQ